MARETTQIVRAELERMCKDFTLRVSASGFARTKKMFWTRRHRYTVDFVHLSREGSSYGAPINHSVGIQLNCGIRVLNDVFPAAALNGPWSDAGTLRQGRYHLRFSANSGSTYERCPEDLVRFVTEIGEPWFGKFGVPEALLQDPSSPLQPAARESLAAALAGHGVRENEAASLRLLGIPRSDRRGELRPRGALSSNASRRLVEDRRVSAARPTQAQPP